MPEYRFLWKVGNFLSSYAMSRPENYFTFITRFTEIDPVKVCADAAWSRKAKGGICGPLVISERGAARMQEI